MWIVWFFLSYKDFLKTAFEGNGIFKKLFLLAGREWDAL
jgi:hypothetical protein